MSKNTKSSKPSKYADIEDDEYLQNPYADDSKQCCQRTQGSCSFAESQSNKPSTWPNVIECPATVQTRNPYNTFQPNTPKSCTTKENSFCQESNSCSCKTGTQIGQNSQKSCSINSDGSFCQDSGSCPCQNSGQDGRSSYGIDSCSKPLKSCQKQPICPPISSCPPQPSCQPQTGCQIHSDYQPTSCQPPPSCPIPPSCYIPPNCQPQQICCHQQPPCFQPSCCQQQPSCQIHQQGCQHQSGCCQHQHSCCQQPVVEDSCCGKKPMVVPVKQTCCHLDSSEEDECCRHGNPVDSCASIFSDSSDCCDKTITIKHTPCERQPIFIPFPIIKEVDSCRQVYACPSCGFVDSCESISGSCCSSDNSSTSYRHSHTHDSSSSEDSYEERKRRKKKMKKKMKKRKEYDDNSKKKYDDNSKKKYDDNSKKKYDGSSGSSNEDIKETPKKDVTQPQTRIIKIIRQCPPPAPPPPPPPAPVKPEVIPKKYAIPIIQPPNQKNIVVVKKPTTATNFLSTQLNSQFDVQNALCPKKFVIKAVPQNPNLPQICPKVLPQICPKPEEQICSKRPSAEKCTQIRRQSCPKNVVFADPIKTTCRKPSPILVRRNCR